MWKTSNLFHEQARCLQEQVELRKTPVKELGHELHAMAFGPAQIVGRRQEFFPVGELKCGVK